jgi:hypothetical protein
MSDAGAQPAVEHLRDKYTPPPIVLQHDLAGRSYRTEWFPKKMMQTHHFGAKFSAGIALTDVISSAVFCSIGWDNRMGQRRDNAWGDRLRRLPIICR